MHIRLFGFIGFVLLLVMPASIFSQDEVFGTWKTIDDVDGEATSHVFIEQIDGKLHGKISKLLNEDPNSVCIMCKDDKKDKPIIGLEIIWDMAEDDGQWSGGRILDPESGKNYKCKIKLVDGVLEVRGYIGIPALGRTQKWYRVE